MFHKDVVVGGWQRLLVKRFVLPYPYIEIIAGMGNIHELHLCILLPIANLQTASRYNHRIIPSYSYVLKDANGIKTNVKGYLILMVLVDFDY